MKNIDQDNVINAPWNMAQLYYIGLNKLLMFKESMYIENDLNGLYRSLDAIHRRLSFKLNKEENEEFVILLKQAKNYFSNLGVNTQHDNVLYEKIAEKLREIDIKIMHLMDKYKMIFPNIEIKSLNGYEQGLGIDKININ